MIRTSTPQLPASITYSAVLGQVLARRRQLQGGIHQKSVADALGITQSAYSRLEGGQSAMSLGQLRRVAFFLGTAPNILLADTDSFVQHLEARGVTVTDDKVTSSSELLIGLGILAAIFASAN